MAEELLGAHAVAENNEKIQRLETEFDQYDLLYQHKLAEYDALRANYASLSAGNTQGIQPSTDTSLDAASVQKLQSEVVDLRRVIEEELIRTMLLAKRLLPHVDSLETQLRELQQASSEDRSQPLDSLKRLKNLVADSERDIEVTGLELNNLSAIRDMKEARLKELDLNSRQHSNQNNSGASYSKAIMEEKTRLLDEIEGLRKANQKQAELLKARALRPTLETKTDDNDTPSPSPSDKGKAWAKKVTGADDPLVKERAAHRHEVQKLQKQLAEEQKQLQSLIAEASVEKKQLDARNKEQEDDITKIERQLRVAWTKKIAVDNQATP